MSVSMIAARPRCTERELFMLDMNSEILTRRQLNRACNSNADALPRLLLCSTGGAVIIGMVDQAVDRPLKLYNAPMCLVTCAFPVIAGGNAAYLLLTA